MSIYKLLDRMLSLVEEAPSLPLFSYKLIDPAGFERLIEQSLAELPDELALSREIVTHEEQIIATAHRNAREILTRAQNEANQVLKRAQDKAERLVDESEILQAINQEADKIRLQVREEAEKIYERTEQEIEQVEEVSKKQIKKSLDESLSEAQMVKKGAYAYAETILGELERLTGSAIQIIQKGQTQIQLLAEANSSEGEFSRFRNALAEVKNIPKEIIQDRPQSDLNTSEVRFE